MCSCRFILFSMFVSRGRRVGRPAAAVRRSVRRLSLRGCSSVRGCTIARPAAVRCRRKRCRWLLRLCSAIVIRHLRWRRHDKARGAGRGRIRCRFWWLTVVAIVVAVSSDKRTAVARPGRSKGTPIARLGHRRHGRKGIVARLGRRFVCMRRERRRVAPLRVGRRRWGTGILVTVRRSAPRRGEIAR